MLRLHSANLVEPGNGLEGKATTFSNASRLSSAGFCSTLVAAVAIGETAAAVASMRTLNGREGARELNRLRAINPSLSLSRSLSRLGVTMPYQLPGER